jgi:hypothetical protein
MVLPFMVLPIMTLPPSMHYFRLSSSIGVTTLELVSYDDNFSLPEWEQQLSIAVLWSTPFHSHFIPLLSHGLHYTITPLVSIVTPFLWSTPSFRWSPLHHHSVGFHQSCSIICACRCHVYYCFPKLCCFRSWLRDDLHLCFWHPLRATSVPPSLDIKTLPNIVLSHWTASYDINASLAGH